MILVTGGLASGKRAYVRSLGYTDADMASAQTIVNATCIAAPGVRSGLADASPVVVDAQELVRRTEASSALLDALAAKDVVVCTEVGCGIVPLDDGERAWRERAGRFAVVLAERAERVVRMVCGIPVVLKG